MAKREKDTYTIRSIHNALNLLEEFKGNRDELGVTELSKRLNLHKNRVFRILATLEARDTSSRTRPPRTTGWG